MEGRMSAKKTKSKTTFVERLQAAAEVQRTSSTSSISWVSLESKMVEAADAGKSRMFLTHDDQVECAIPNTSDSATRKLVLQAMETRYVGLRATARRNPKGQDTTPWTIRLEWSKRDEDDICYEDEYR
jgi:hypothetical protein